MPAWDITMADDAQRHTFACTGCCASECAFIRPQIHKPLGSALRRLRTLTMRREDPAEVSSMLTLSKKHKMFRAQHPRTEYFVS
jgi:hypothetical protein